MGGRRKRGKKTTTKNGIHDVSFCNSIGHKDFGNSYNFLEGYYSHTTFSASAAHIDIDAHKKDFEEYIFRKGIEKLTLDKMKRIVGQIEYYFSDRNLPTDVHLLKQIEKGKGCVTIAHLCTFRKMKKILNSKNWREVSCALIHGSTSLLVSKDGRCVKRRVPLKMDKKLETTVIVRNLSRGSTIDSIKKIFSAIGSVIQVKRIEERVASVEFEDVVHATDAVHKLNDEVNWRFGLRVQLASGKKIKKKNKIDDFKKKPSTWKPLNNIGQSKLNDKTIDFSKIRKFRSNKKKRELQGTSQTQTQNRENNSSILSSKIAKGPQKGSLGFNISRRIIEE